MLKVSTPIQKRFADIDAYRHVNNVAQQSYFDTGKEALFVAAFGTEAVELTPQIVTVSTHTQYFGQIRREEQVEVVSTVEKIGDKSLTLFQQILCNGEVRSESRSVMVAFDIKSQTSVSVPDEWRQILLDD